ncbi:xanthine dehydrogenase accessory factor [Rhizobium aethiopicum]|uniref:Xanthine dehydrogenase accessory factor n=1 Tax=Rhizobium aethiopicum TaxID=1138170 RepID=A0A7W6Q9P7_9HYPH|nr:XdhC family protein [Rhizobium aethiopicum]MBB4193414.1 xanthine dehydrogenase accessory factor [Rhizobium aethiopicum]MBB4580670.1 xanthine dehydrogenase accessory factor [Rhizobium aethiopicum]
MIQTALFLPTPVRAASTDDPGEILSFLAAVANDGGEVALATLVEIRGGAARALGSQVAVSSDGRYCGYVSGGCVEAAVASEAIKAIAEGRDRVIKYGDGSPYFDIVLPCGGGVTIAIHVMRGLGQIHGVLDTLELRRAAALRYSPSRQRVEGAETPARSGWYGEDFVTVYRPRTRIVVSGETIEAEAVAAVARASGYDVIMRNGSGRDLADAIDEFTAVIMLHHDLDAEEQILGTAMRSAAFYIGALGSTRTHKRRQDRLRDLGWSASEIERIKAPIGFFGPTRDASSLALSVLADVAASRLSAYG